MVSCTVEWRARVWPTFGVAPLRTTRERTDAGTNGSQRIGHPHRDRPRKSLRSASSPVVHRRREGDFVRTAADLLDRHDERFYRGAKRRNSVELALIRMQQKSLRRHGGHSCTVYLFLLAGRVDHDQDACLERGQQRRPGADYRGQVGAKVRFTGQGMGQWFSRSFPNPFSRIGLWLWGHRFKYLFHRS